MSQQVSGEVADAGHPSVVRSGDQDTPVKLVEVASAASIESHLSIRPRGGCRTFGEQLDSIYTQLENELLSRGIAPRDVVLERVFLTDIDNQFNEFQARRAKLYSGSDDGAPLYPAAIANEQPLLVSGQLCELQVFALRAANGASLVSRNIPGLESPVTGRLLEADGFRQLYLTNLTSHPGETDHPGRMFRHSVDLLRQEGFTFADVVRTWIFIPDLERDYAALNEARNEFFKTEGIRPPPASTGIQGTVYPSSMRWGMGLTAIKSVDAPLVVRQVSSPGMGEAYSYGSAFSRGTAVELDDRVIVYISGTASIDDNNRVAHLNDIEGQLGLMFRNIEQLLGTQGCTVEHVTHGTTYLKQPEFLAAFRRVSEEHGFSSKFVNTVCRADVCRPEWLCEMEVTAVLPRRVSQSQTT